jgi:predicted DNA-binding transcriptional regulator AlpA
MSRFLRRKAVLARYGITNSTLYRWIEEKKFPAPVKLVEGGTAAGWPLEELEARDREIIAAQRKAQAAA